MRDLWTLEKGPILITGLLLLAVAVILLGGFGTLSPNAPRALDLLPLALAVFFVAVALLPVLRRRSAAAPAGAVAPGPAPLPDTNAPAPSAPIWDESGLIEDSLAVLPAVPPIPAPPRYRDRSHPSIPSAWAYASEDVDPFPPSWPPSAPPAGAALPFYPAVAQAPFVPQGLDPQSEIDRLRARVRELEAPGSAPRPDHSEDRVDLSYPAISRARTIPEPPALRTPIGAATGCAGCGTLLAEHHASPLCWGCGRSLCASCYWHFGPGPGLHRCPACYGHAGSMASAARSGAHSGLPPALGTGTSAGGGPSASVPTAGR